MKPVGSTLFVGCLVFILGAGLCLAESRVSGIVVDENEKPIEGVRCKLVGFPLPEGGRNIYTGTTSFQMTDKEGRFAFENRRSDPLLDIHFDGGDHTPDFPYAPAFLHKASPADSPHRVVMTEGKVLRGKVVEPLEDKLVPVKATHIDFRLPLDDLIYGNRQLILNNGEFQFRVCKPPERWPWMLVYASTGKRVSIDYDKITPQTVVTINVAVSLNVSYEQTPGAYSNKVNTDLAGNAQE
jgi:hypothetical protein